MNSSLSCAPTCQYFVGPNWGLGKTGIRILGLLIRRVGRAASDGIVFVRIGLCNWLVGVLEQRSRFPFFLKGLERESVPVRKQPSWLPTLCAKGKAMDMKKRVSRWGIERLESKQLLTGAAGMLNAGSAVWAETGALSETVVEMAACQIRGSGSEGVRGSALASEKQASVVAGEQPQRLQDIIAILGVQSPAATDVDAVFAKR